tara:strand:- start:4347 stop:4808 length:462 start_codon:yes stop_codon:yes gene_type:complete
MLYFAYGSNMDPQQMRRRCPGYRFVGIAMLADHKLAFSRRSPRRRCGVADVIPSPGDEVWGVLYHIISRREVLALDKAEGFKMGRKRVNGYDRERRKVWSPCSPHKPLTASLYIARQHLNPPPPSEHYLRLMLSGATHWRLPTKYQLLLQSIK